MRKENHSAEEKRGILKLQRDECFPSFSPVSSVIDFFQFRFILDSDQRCRRWLYIVYISLLRYVGLFIEPNIIIARLHRDEYQFKAPIYIKEIPTAVSSVSIYFRFLPLHNEDSIAIG
jgi:hypothetical protein